LAEVLTAIVLCPAPGDTQNHHPGGAQMSVPQTDDVLRPGCHAQFSGPYITGGQAASGAEIAAVDVANQALFEGGARSQVFYQSLLLISCNPE